MSVAELFIFDDSYALDELSNLLEYNLSVISCCGFLSFRSGIVPLDECSRVAISCRCFIMIWFSAVWSVELDEILFRS